MTATTHSQTLSHRKPFRMNQSGHVYGIVDDLDRAQPAVTADLLAAQIPSAGIHFSSSTADVDDVGHCSGPGGFRAWIGRLLQTVDGHLPRVEAELRAGHGLIGVAVDDARKEEVAQILHRHSGHDVVYYGKYTWQTLGA